MRGHHHAYLEQWSPSIGEVISLKREPDNSHDSYSVAVVKGETVVGHVPRPANRVCFHFLGRDGHRGFCQVTGSRINRGVNVGLEVPCIYRFYGNQRYIDRLNSLLNQWLMLLLNYHVGR